MFGAPLDRLRFSVRGSDDTCRRGTTTRVIRHLPVGLIPCLGRLAGILWHQGEKHSQQSADADSYGERLTRMIASLRSVPQAPLVPSVAGELGEFLAGHETCRAHFREVNDQLRGLCGRVARYGCTSAAGLADKGDRVHFDSASLREFGRLYAEFFIHIAGEHTV